MTASFHSRDLVIALKAAAEPTRLRILMLLEDGELNVKDLTRILGQSQPRLSRHLKLLFEAGLVERFREGSWVYFHLSDRGAPGRLVHDLTCSVAPSDAVRARDRERAERLKLEREAAAQSYFAEHAEDWHRIRTLHLSEEDVEAAMREALGPGPFGLLVDLGTGTGRSLELFSDIYARGLGIDVNQAMLAVARANLSKVGLNNAHVRHGDIYSLSVDSGAADAVIMHQVLHYLRDPGMAIREAARLLAPGGRLLIVDFAPHELEFLRDSHAHARLGFDHATLNQWMRDAGLAPLVARDLAPSVAAEPAASGQEKLTVSLWLAERPGSPSRPRASAGMPLVLEETRT